jgi:regulator of sigma E protease
MTVTSLAIFFGILFFLVVVHEGGHFIFAKLAKMRVDEFAFGFPPNLFSKKIGETKYVFNLLPLGGYVKIFGEQGLSDEELNSQANQKDLARSFDRQGVWARLFVLSGGVIFNLIACVLLLALSLSLGSEVALDTEMAKATPSENRSLVVADVLPQSNLYKQGLRQGDKITVVQADNGKVLDKNNLFAEAVTQFTKDNNGSLIHLSVESESTKEIKTYSAVPQAGLVEGKKILGISLVDTAYKQYTFSESLVQAGRDTVSYTKYIFGELGKLLKGVFTQEGDVKQALSGPIGMAVATKQIAEKSFSNIVAFAALISLSLAVFNILPIPALDGGRILFVLSEVPYKLIFKKSIPKKIEQTTHAIGFLFLIGLMLLVTYFDILKLLA